MLDGAVGVVLHLGGRHGAALVVLEGLKVHQVVVLAEDVGVALVVGYAGVVATGAVGVAYDVARRCPGTGGAVAHGVAQPLVTAGGGKAQVVFVGALVEPRAFLVIVDVGQLGDADLHRSHVVVEQGVVAVGVAPVEVCLSVVVGVDRGVYVVPVLLLPHERLAQGVAERAVGRVAHEHADAVSVERGIEVVRAVALNGLDGPGPVVAAAPGEVLQRGHGPVLRPVHHVGGAPQQPVVHEESRRALLPGVGNVLGRGIVRGVEEERVAHDERRRVGGVLGLEERQVDGLVVA